MVNVQWNLQREKIKTSKLCCDSYSKLFCHKVKTHSLKWSNSPWETEPNKKKERFCLQITAAQIGLTTQERQNQVKKKERFCLQITTAQIGLTTQERQNQVKKKERFYLQITKTQIGLTTQERQNQVKLKTHWVRLIQEKRDLWLLTAESIWIPAHKPSETL